MPLFVLVCNYNKNLSIRPFIAAESIPPFTESIEKTVKSFIKEEDYKKFEIGDTYTFTISEEEKSYFFDDSIVVVE